MSASAETDRWALGRVQNPVRGILDSVAALAFLVATIVLFANVPVGPPLHRAALIVYSATVVAMFSVSTSYHTIAWGERWRRRLQHVDHAMIYLLVASTFTVLYVTAVEGTSKWWGIGGIWLLSAAGITHDMGGRRTGWVAMRLMFLAGAVTLVPFWELLTRVGTVNAVLIVVGGVIYLIGTSMFVKSWPRLAPRIFSHHEVFHILVILAALAHFVAVWRLIAGSV